MLSRFRQPDFVKEWPNTAMARIAPFGEESRTRLFLET